MSDDDRGDEKLKRNLLFIAFGLLVAVILIAEGNPLVAVWMILVIALSWAVLQLVLIRTKPKVGEYVDWWSIVHVLSGILLGLLSVSLLKTVVVLVLWEVVEGLAGVKEPRTNRIADVLIGLLGWFLATLVI
jgi:NADH:ubiquinone oxidoreductase subunit 6 (subunit J)